jgi:PBP1b-binding outer membrane lipoprotein LpoB
MLIKKSKLTLLGLAIFSAMAITSCNNEAEKKDEPAKDTTAAPATAPADTTPKPADTIKIDTADTKGIKNPG